MWRRILFGFLVALVLAAVTIAWLASRPVLPHNLTRQVSFQLYYPARPWRVDGAQASYNQSVGVLSFSAEQHNQELVFTEQATPDPFTAAPQYYPALLSKLNEYQALDTAVGTVHLVHPSELNGGQAAVLNSGGTLMFIRPNRNLSDNAWRELFNGLIIKKPGQ